jgi:hypothetical protein
MIRARLFASILLAAPLLAGAAAHAQSAAPDSALYALNSPASEFEWGCFAPCMCPILVQSPLTGSFILRRSAIDLLYTYYDVLDVRWSPGAEARFFAIAGSGTYRRGGGREQLTLDLSFDGGPVQHFDSGLTLPGAPFPLIDTHISLHGEYCHDSVLVVDARPFNVATVVGQPAELSLSAAPNPFSTSTEIAFVLPRDGVVDLGVYDVSGRRVRTLVGHEWFTSGPYVRGWDGRLENGTSAKPGLYFVRLDVPSARTSRTVVKLR